MTSTEDRLADALAAVGRSVREETLPPLPARSLSPAPRRWGRWLVPLAAAASVILVVVLVSAVHLFPGKPGRGNALTTSPPRYYAALDKQGRSIVIRATATGAVTGKLTESGGHSSFPSAIAATDGGRKFVVAYSGTLADHQERTWLYAFHLTAAGQITGFAPIRGSVFTGVSAANAIAVSPDGSQVAVALYPPINPVKPPPPPAEIGVVNLRTGAQALWAGGMHRAGFEFNVASVSWLPDGRSLLYLGVWCQGELSGVPYCTTGSHIDQVRTLRLTPGGGRLDQGSVLLTDSGRYPDIVQALAGPGGKSINLAELTGPAAGTVFPQPRNLQVVSVPLDHGQPRLLYRAAVDSHPYVFLGSDASGRYLLLAWARNGWIDQGRLRPLPLPGRPGLTFSEAW